MISSADHTDSVLGSPDLVRSRLSGLKPQCILQKHPEPAAARKTGRLGAIDKALPPALSTNYKLVFYRHQKFRLAKQFLFKTKNQLLSATEILLL